MTLTDWLQIPCLPEDVSGDEHEGFYLGIDIVKDKLKIMESRFFTFLNYSNFNHFLFNAHNKNTYASGSIEIEIVSELGDNPTESPYATTQSPIILRRLIGTATFNIFDYDNDKTQNGNYASILKSLCTAQALKEFPQFGSLLNKESLVKIVQGKRNNFKTDKAVLKTLQNG